MKKISLTVIAMAFATSFSYAQTTYWTPNTGNDIYNTNSGNVGIGTMTPLSPLHVNGNIAAMASAGTDNFYLMFQRPYDGYIGARVGNAYSFSGYGGHMVFETNNGGGPTSLVERMRITNAGSVGIGTTFPRATLDVGASAGTPLLTTYGYAPEIVNVLSQVSSSNASNATQTSVGLNLANTSQTDGTYSPLIGFSRLSNDGSYNSIYSAIGGIGYSTGDANWIYGAMTFLTTPNVAGGPLERMRIDPSGNVGIGTSSPASLLQVSGTMSSSAANGLPTGTPVIAMQYNATDNAGEIYSINNGVAWKPMILGANTFSFLSASTSSQGVYQDANANVGIGTTTPQSKLDVSGSVRTSSYVFAYDSGSDEAILVNPAGGNNIQGVNSGNTAYKNITLQGGGGNVGIGTATPDEKLSVNGNIHAQEVLVNLTGFEDRVFKKTYHLLTLPEVKTYIDKNHHLPDVPSEAEVVKNGLNVGNMERTLTKKVEELTLYLIEKDKEIADQKRQQKTTIQALQKEINELRKQFSTLRPKK